MVKSSLLMTILLVEDLPASVLPSTVKVNVPFLLEGEYAEPTTVKPSPRSIASVEV